MRPVDIEADVKEMERRKRVEAIMNSQVFILMIIMMMDVMMTMRMMISSNISSLTIRQERKT